MKISDDTKRVVQFIEDIYPNAIQKKDDLSSILEIGATYNLHTQINELIFTAASIKFMRKKLISSPVNDASTDKIKIEFQRSLKDFKSMVQNISKIAEENQFNISFKHFLNSDADSIANLIALSSDLSLLKNVQKKSGKRN